MKITALQEYGIRCVLQLAKGNGGEPLTTSVIAEKEGLSRDYVEKILFQLRKKNIVKSVRGTNGGYVLGRDPNKIHIGEIFTALTEKPVRIGFVKDDLCGQFPGKEDQCVHFSGCAVRMLWSVVLLQVSEVLNKMPLSILIGNEAEVQNRIRKLANGGKR